MAPLPCFCFLVPFLGIFPSQTQADDSGSPDGRALHGPGHFSDVNRGLVAKKCTVSRIDSGICRIRPVDGAPGQRGSSPVAFNRDEVGRIQSAGLVMGVQVGARGFPSLVEGSTGERSPLGHGGLWGAARRLPPPVPPKGPGCRQARPGLPATAGAQRRRSMGERPSSPRPAQEGSMPNAPGCRGMQRGRHAPLAKIVL